MNVECVLYLEYLVGVSKTKRFYEGVNYHVKYSFRGAMVPLLTQTCSGAKSHISHF